MSINKVRCAVCEYQKNKFCEKKKCIVSLNKGRKCTQFKLAPKKLKEKSNVPTIKVPYTSTRKYYKESLKSRQSIRHPFTGDLSRFSSTVEKG